MATQVTLNSGSVDSAGSLALKTNGTTTAVTINTSQGVEFNAGTAAAPTITTTGDTNTGIFFPAADTIAFSEGGVEAMRIDSSGNVGIGTNSPSQKLQVVGEALFGGAGTYQTVFVNNNSATGGGAFGVQQNGVTRGSYGTSGAWIGDTSSDLAIAAIAPNIRFFTNNSSSERMRIDSSGNLLVGTTSSSFGEKLSVQSTASGTNIAYLNYTYTDDRSNTIIQHSRATGATSATMILFRNASSSSVGLISSTGSATTYTTSSDYRLKENIAPMTGALAKVSLLNPCVYKWKVDGSDGQGFIAHELAEVCPQAVVGEKDGEEMQGVDYGKITPLLTAALQEAIAKIETLEVRISALEAK